MWDVWIWKEYAGRAAEGLVGEETFSTFICCLEAVLLKQNNWTSKDI